MRILHVAPSVARTYGGPVYSLQGYVRAARAAGAEVDVFAPACADDERIPMAPGLDGEARTFPVQGRNAFVVSPALWSALMRDGKRYDVVHVHGAFNPVSAIAARIAITRGWPLVIRPFGTLSAYTFEHRRRALKRVFFSLLEGPNLRRAQAVHFTTQGERKNAEWHGIGFEGRAHVIPPPYVEPTTGPVRDAHNPPVALFLARLNPVKDLESLLAAWPFVLESVADARLVVAGDGNEQYAAKLRALAEHLGIAATVEFTGFVAGEEKRRLLATATVFVLPSHHENFGLALLEAVGAGMPAVITPEVQLADLIQRHGLGIVTARDPAVLAEAVIRGLRDRNLQEHCRLHAPGLVADEFSDAAVGERLMRMYESAMRAL